MAIRVRVSLCHISHGDLSLANIVHDMYYNSTNWRLIVYELHNCTRMGVCQQPLNDYCTEHQPEAATQSTQRLYIAHKDATKAVDASSQLCSLASCKQAQITTVFPW